MKRVQLLALSVSIALSGCDWIANHFFNSVSLQSRAGGGAELPTEPMRVYIGVDGLSHDMVKAIIEGDDTFQQDQGTSTLAVKRIDDFKPSIDWQLAAATTIFPATSDSCWTRMMGAKPLEGHEFAYYDPTQDRIINEGVPGLAKHVIPTFADTFSTEADYLHAFDVQANGYLHRMIVYQNQFNSFSETLDQVFYVLEGRLRTQSVFSAYVAEIDAVGHMLESYNADLLVRLLLKKIEDFRDSHPEREIHFTLFSDHGMDFSPLPDDEIQRRVKLIDLMPTVGVTPVAKLKGLTPDLEAPQALPVGHVRVTYEAANTLPELVEEVSRRLSTADPIDVVVARLPDCPEALSPSTKICHGIWAEGLELLTFGFSEVDSTHRILLEAAGIYVAARLDLPEEGPWSEIRAGEAGETFSLDDSETFEGTVWRDYPDFLHRIRTGLEAQHILNPPDILVSYRKGYVAKGFSLPFGSDDVASHGFHGSLSKEGALGVVMTTERPLPEAVRADQLMQLFPELAKHVTRRFKEHRRQ